MNKAVKNAVNNLVRIELRILFEGFRGFNLKYFKNLNSADAMVNYAKKHLPFLGKGMSRTVFGLGAGKVLKIQHSGKEALFNQNEDEVKAYTSPKISKEYLAKIYDFDKENYFWVISEGVQVIADNTQLMKKFKVNDGVLSDFIINIITHNFKFEDAVKKALERYNKFKHPAGKIDVKDLTDFDIKLLKGVSKLIKQGVDDASRLRHWGITTNGRIVLVDYGIGDYED